MFKFFRAIGDSTSKSHHTSDPTVELHTGALTLGPSFP